MTTTANYNRKIRTTKATPAFACGTRNQIQMPAGAYIVINENAKHTTFQHDDMLAHSANDHRPAYVVPNATAARLIAKSR